MGRLTKGIMLFVLMVMFTAIILTIIGRSTRSNENTDALVTAIETSLDNVMRQKTYTINDSDEFAADFLQTLLLTYKSDSDLTVKILDKDMEKGILSVEVDETYSHPNGKTGTVSVQRTVIFDKKEETGAIYYTITYQTEGRNYKIYTIAEGERLIVPASPKKEGRQFDHWKNRDSGTRVNPAAMTAEQDYTFEAVFH